jgi:hypothetical protein
MTKDKFILPKEMVESINNYVDKKFIKITHIEKYLDGYDNVEIEYDPEKMFEIVLQVFHSGKYYGMNKITKVIFDK